jgi:hypothetical protein
MVDLKVVRHVRASHATALALLLSAYLVAVGKHLRRSALVCDIPIARATT